MCKPTSLYASSRAVTVLMPSLSFKNHVEWYMVLQPLEASETCISISPSDLNGILRSMHLPEAIEVSTGSGVPPSILQKAAEIRVKGGYEKINNMYIVTIHTIGCQVKKMNLASV